MPGASAEVQTLSNSVYYSNDQNEVNMAAQTLVALIGTFSPEDKAYVLSKMNSSWGSSEPAWRKQIAMGVIVAVRNFA